MRPEEPSEFRQPRTDLMQGRPSQRLITVVHNQYRCGAYSSGGANCPYKASTKAQVQDTCKKWPQAAPVRNLAAVHEGLPLRTAQFICYSIEIIGPPSDHRPIHFRTPRAKRPLHWGSVPRDYQPPLRTSLFRTALFSALDPCDHFLHVS